MFSNIAMNTWLYSHNFMAIQLDHINLIKIQQWSENNACSAIQPRIHGYMVRPYSNFQLELYGHVTQVIQLQDKQPVIHGYIAVQLYSHVILAIQPCIHGHLSHGYIAIYIWLYSQQPYSMWQIIPPSNINKISLSYERYYQ